MNKFSLPIIACGLAVLITSLMDFNGLFMFSSLSLIFLTAVFWIINKISKKDIGLVWGKLKYYGIALLYPLVVLGCCFLVAYLMKDYSFEDTDWKKIMFNISMASTIGIIMTLITEEGFFRGWLWGTLRLEGVSQTNLLWITSALFTIWHISAVLSGTDYGLPLHQVPIYLSNAFLLGMIWGVMRQQSGSIIVPSVSHAVWNGLAYELFGFGEKTGALGIENTYLLGPEVGVLGIALNVLFLFFIWKRNPEETSDNRFNDL